jgi:Protein of unknown function (DUF3305)
MQTDILNIAVVMQRTPLANRWQPWSWKPIEISAATLLPGNVPHLLRNDDSDTRWLFPGFDIKLYTDEAEGYFLNVDAPEPCWFLMWRIEELDGKEVAVPKQVTLSYNEAARLMDGGERVDTLPASSDIIDLLRGFVQEHYRPEVKKKRRKPSFEGGAGVEQMARQEGTQGEGHGR